MIKEIKNEWCKDIKRRKRVGFVYSNVWIIFKYEKDYWREIKSIKIVFNKWSKREDFW